MTSSTVTPTITPTTPTTTPHLCVLLAGRAADAYAAILVGLCEARLQAWQDAYHLTPGRHVTGKIIFGNGTEYVTWRGKDIFSWDHPAEAATLWDAIRDIWKITNGYTHATPNDFTF